MLKHPYQTVNVRKKQPLEPNGNDNNRAHNDDINEDVAFTRKNRIFFSIVKRKKKTTKRNMNETEKSAEKICI